MGSKKYIVLKKCEVPEKTRLGLQCQTPVKVKSLSKNKFALKKLFVLVLLVVVLVAVTGGKQSQLLVPRLKFGCGLRTGV